ncbi:MAG: nucleoside-diphosphate kinase [Chlamydiota bacterium]
MEKTLSLIKPDATKKHVIGAILHRFEKEGLKIAAIKMLNLSKERAASFYSVHSHLPFFQELVEFMSSGPIVALILEGENAVEKNRQIMGATDPKKAAEGTLRALYGDNVGENAVHGSDSLENAQKEIFFFFEEAEVFSSSK